jgi:hypothetical protein
MSLFLDAKDGIPYKITYYCGKRKKYFTRNALIDDTIEMKRKLNGCIFTTIVPALSSKDCKYGLIILKLNGHFIAQSGDGASVPAYLFGREYFRARRFDTSTLWDFRKAAFCQVKKEEIT